MKKLKILGLVLFLVGFGIFNSLFFIHQYSIRQVDTSIYLSERQDSLFHHLSEDFSQEIYFSSFSFANKLSELIDQINDFQLKRYSLTPDEINRLTELYQESLTFGMIGIEDIFDKSEPGQFKANAFKNFGGWLEGRTFSNAEELRTSIEAVSENIKLYGVINQKGIDRYKKKDLLYTLTKQSTFGRAREHNLLMFFLSIGLSIIGAFIYVIIPDKKQQQVYKSSISNRGWMGILTGTYLILFYIILYYFPQYMTGWVILADPVSMFIKGSEAGPFFLYGLLYTISILVMGIRMLLKYPNNRYQQIRTLSVMFFQTAFAFLIPEILIRLNKPYFDFKNIWPLDYDFFFDSQLNELLSHGSLGLFMLGWGIFLILLGVPVLVYFFGKRWYCSWVCGCGGLAETLGDPFRQLSDKTLKAWKAERIVIHAVLVLSIIMTIGVVYTYWTGESNFLGINTYNLREAYGFWIGAAFAGVIGTGFYPLMGNRVWCRFGCPLAAYLGIIQRFKSRFRITTNGGQCISCGNCSTYCEMGIDVRWYAQRGQNIIRASCVGCGVCSSVCPRGVLKLENKDEKTRL